ncbi:hypothetical protein Tco_0991948 [Tanacetum coccineum]|uniref:Uncharacterized protein n=1 Tax=Tanacetum coccineum TaxID=301880 RepID=A0ABQ5F112_9ASTR
MIVATGKQSVVHLERISELERDNTRLRGMLDVASQRTRGMTMPNTRSGATMTREAVDNQLVAEWQKRWKHAMPPETLNP